VNIELKDIEEGAHGSAADTRAHDQLQAQGGTVAIHGDDGSEALQSGQRVCGKLWSSGQQCHAILTNDNMFCPVCAEYYQQHNYDSDKKRASKRASSSSSSSSGTGAKNDANTAPEAGEDIPVDTLRTRRALCAVKDVLVNQSLRYDDLNMMVSIPALAAPMFPNLTYVDNCKCIAIELANIRS
jgi:hypothetical protein